MFIYVLYECSMGGGGGGGGCKQGRDEGIGGSASVY